MNRVRTKIHGFYKYHDLLEQLVMRDIKLKYRRSFLGYLWSVLNPLGTMVVVALIFAQIFRFEIVNYPAYLITGQVLFNFVLEATNQGITSITGNAALLKKTYVPKYIFTVSKVTSSLVNLLFSMIALFLVLVLTHTSITWYALLFPFVILQLYIFCLGLGLFLAQAAVFFRDVQYIFGVLTTLWMYATPIFYPISVVPETMAKIIMVANPLTGYLIQFRSLLVYGQMPSSEIVLFGIFWSVAMLLLGLVTFHANQDKFILYI